MQSFKLFLNVLFMKIKFVERKKRLLQLYSHKEIAHCKGKMTIAIRKEILCEGELILQVVRVHCNLNKPTKII